MSPLITDWITIGTAGPTVDGRTISDQMLLDAAETYDPNEYTAMISSDHLLWLYGNFGKVCSVRTSKDKKNRTTLQAKIQPNRRLIQMNAEGQRLHTSMELQNDFAKSGKTYLMGLAVTDEPASLGTSLLQFSNKNRNSNPTMFIGESVTLDIEQDEAVRDTEPTNTGFKTFFHTLFNELRAPCPPNSVTQGDDNMTPEQFEALKKLHEQQISAMENLTTLLTVQSNQSSETEPESNNESQSQAAESTDDLKEFMTNLTNKLETISCQLEKATTWQPGTQLPHNVTFGSDIEARFA